MQIEPCDPGRRSFLSAMAAGLSLTPLALRADVAARKPISFCVVSDTHLGYQGRGTATEVWKKTAAELKTAPGSLVLHLGDVVDGGREDQYGVYREIRDTIAKPVHEIPGNHDPQALFEKHLRKPIDSVVEVDWLRILLLGNTRFESHDGFLSGAQLDWIDGQCRLARDRRQRIVLAMHVPAHENRHPDRGWHVKPKEGQTRLYELLEQWKEQVLALFHGHFHNGIRGWTDHLPVNEIVFPSALYNQDRRLEEQKAPGYNVEEFRPGFTLVTVMEEKLLLEFRIVGSSDRVEKQLDRVGR